MNGVKSAKSKPAPAATPGTAALSLPAIVSPHLNAYCPQHVDLRLNARQAETLKTLEFSLQSAGVEVRSGGDAVKWLLDQIAALWL